jgi:predicted lipoprotein with Yx(FWY)xxD motif
VTEEPTMRRRPINLLSLAAVVAASLALAACGSDSGSSAASGAALTADTVAIKHVDGLGEVLVDGSGMALYTPDQDTAKKIRCTGGCTAFWQPLAPGGGKPTAADGAGKLSVVERPDGTRQVAADGRSLYTFSEDSAGSITGDGFQDEFGGRHFVWHVVLAGTAPATTATPTSGGAGGYGY